MAHRAGSVPCLHVLLQLAAALQEVHIALDGHVVQAQQPAELDAERLAQLYAEGRLPPHMQSLNDCEVRPSGAEDRAFICSLLSIFNSWVEPS